MACIVCNSPSGRRAPGSDGDYTRFECDRCGLFALTGTAESVLSRALDEGPLRRALMSHTLRRMQQSAGGRIPILGSNELSTFWASHRLPSPQRQADGLVLWIGDHQATPLDYAVTTTSALA